VWIFQFLRTIRLPTTTPSASRHGSAFVVRIPKPTPTGIKRANALLRRQRDIMQVKIERARYTLMKRNKYSRWPIAQPLSMYFWRVGEEKLHRAVGF
jgi:hypothetical protein